MKHMYKCIRCNKYTMKEICACKENTLAPRPLKFTADDRLASYRRAAKLQDYKKRGLL